MKPAAPPPAANRTARPAAIPSCCFVQTISTIPLIHICLFICNDAISSIHENTILSIKPTGGTKKIEEISFRCAVSADMALLAECDGVARLSILQPVELAWAGRRGHSETPLAADKLGGPGADPRGRRQGRARIDIEEAGIGRPAQGKLIRSGAGRNAEQGGKHHSIPD